MNTSNLNDCDKYNCDPPTLNIKCVIFTLFIVFVYWFLPPRNKWILILLIFIPYVLLAWYDYIYQCERNSGPSYLSLFYKNLKPPETDPMKKYDNWHPTIKKRVFFIDLSFLLIILLFIPIFIEWTPKK